MRHFASIVAAATIALVASQGLAQFGMIGYSAGMSAQAKANRLEHRVEKLEERIAVLEESLKRMGKP